MPGLPRQSIQKLLHFGLGGDALDGPPGLGQRHHAGRILFQDLIPFGVAEDGGYHRQILLGGGLLDGLSVTGPLPQFRQQILHVDGPQAAEGDGADVRVHRLQHPAVGGQRAGGVPGLPIQPPAGVFLEAHAAVLAEAVLHQPLKFLRLVRHILRDLLFADGVRHGNGLGTADFPSVGPVPVADGDLIFTRLKLLDTCHS